MQSHSTSSVSGGRGAQVAQGRLGRGKIDRASVPLSRSARGDHGGPNRARIGPRGAARRAGCGRPRRIRRPRRFPIACMATSRRRRPTCCGSATSRRSARGKAGSTWRRSSTCSRACAAGGCAVPHHQGAACEQPRSLPRSPPGELMNLQPEELIE